MSYIAGVASSYIFERKVDVMGRIEDETSFVDMLLETEADDEREPIEWIREWVKVKRMPIAVKFQMIKVIRNFDRRSERGKENAKKTAHVKAAK